MTDLPTDAGGSGDVAMARPGFSLVKRPIAAYTLR
jgi:hypothetical protein